MKLTVRGAVAAMLVVLVAAVCVRLGFWQLDRLQERRAYNASVRAAMSVPPVELDAETFAAAAADPEAYTYRRVRVTGAYRPQVALVLRGRSLGGRPGVNAVNALDLPHGGVVLVNRGWIPAPDGATVEPDEVRASGAAALEGMLEPLARTGDAGAPARVPFGPDTLLTYRRLDLDESRRLAGAPVLPLYVRLLPAGEAAESPPYPPPLPELSEGNHLSYALQWFSFAVIAIAGLLVLVRHSHRNRSRPV